MRLVVHGVASLTLVFLVSRCTPIPSVRPPRASRPPVMALPADVRVSIAGRVTSVPLEDYVLGTSLSEVSPVGESPAATARIFEVQAVLARTFAAAHLGRHAAQGYDLCDDTHCQLYQPGRVASSRFARVAREAVAKTRGRVVTFAGRPAEALFHSDCGGHTAPSTSAWGGAPVPYLAGRRDNVPGATHRPWEFSVATAPLRAALNSDPRSAVGARLDDLAILERDTSGRAVRIAIKGERQSILRAEQIRAIVNGQFGDRAIQSTRFTVKHSGSRWTFHGTGFGHGVGLCQVGAAARARRGESLERILLAYFPATEID